MLEGAMVALITPFSNGKLDKKQLRRLVRFHEKHDTDVVVPCGTTGESATLTHEEHEEVIEIVVDEAEELDVMAGTGSNSTHEAVRFTRHADEVGCEAALVITPYYNKPPQRGMVSHFEKVADSASIDIVLYNVPSRTGINLSAEAVVKLSRIDNIVGVKEASGDLSQITEICHRTPDDFAVLSGDDGLTLPILSVGGAGVVSVLANILPDKISQLTWSFKKGNTRRARDLHQELHPLVKAMFWETNPIPVKFAASQLRLCDNEVRSPLSTLDSSYHEDLIELMEEADLSPEQNE
ncbi:MAG: 4-hydroxy-tetrahydrodipicolinate synthase [bacterium]